MNGPRSMIVGTGFMGRVHLETLRRIGNVDAFAISGLSATELQHNLDDPAVGAVHICAPNATHFRIASAALRAGKHVLCEKPLATSTAEARELVALATETKLLHATNYNLRYYPMVQQMRSMCHDGDVGDILIVQGTYSQDWLLFDTDWNWRVDSSDGGPSRALADIGSHWCDLAEHITGQRITSLCADLQTFHKTRKRPLGAVETFAGLASAVVAQEEVPVATEDFGAVLFQMGQRTRGSYTASQVSAGCKNRLVIEIFGSKCGLAWNGERPDELWIGKRDENNQILLKDPSLMKPAARDYADLPGGHSEGYDDTFKQMFRRFYQRIMDLDAPLEYPRFQDGYRQLQILEAELESHRHRSWVEVPL